MIPARSETSLIQVVRRTLEEICCPYCRDSLGAETKSCPGCETRYHSACALELPSCAVLGCEAVIGANSAPCPRDPEAEGRQILGGILLAALLLLAPFLPTLLEILTQSAHTFVGGIVGLALLVWVMLHLWLEA